MKVLPKRPAKRKANKLFNFGDKGPDPGDWGLTFYRGRRVSRGLRGDARGKRGREAMTLRRT